MGLFSFFKKKNKDRDLNAVEENTEIKAELEKNTMSLEQAEIDSDMIKGILEELEEETKRPVINIEVLDGEPALTESKFGGLPYIPADKDVPTDSQNRQLRLLAQLNLEELPKNDILPDKGILQFWALHDDLIGLELDALNKNDRSRVIYLESIDETVTAEQVRDKYKPFNDENSHFPVDGEFKLTFALSEEGISSNTYLFDKLFTDKWNKAYPDNKIKNIYDLPEDEDEDLFGDMQGFGHKIGGYAGFTQEDPRSESNYLSSCNVLLLQIDSIGTETHGIMWGDSGICNFFISENDLKNKDFSKSVYNWDCY